MNAAKAAGEDSSVLQLPIIRLDINRQPLVNLYDEMHHSDDGEGDEEADGESRSGRKRGNAPEGDLTERQKAQLEKEAAEKQQLEVNDAQYFDLEEDLQASQEAGLLRVSADAPEAIEGEGELV